MYHIHIYKIKMSKSRKVFRISWIILSDICWFKKVRENISLKKDNHVILVTKSKD